MNRRSFIKSIIAAGSYYAIPSFGNNFKSSSFELHPFIIQNPEAVFIFPTAAIDKYDQAGKLAAGKSIGKSIFVESNGGGNAFSKSSRIVIKPNLTERGKWQKGYTIERSMGVVTDVFFVEGFIDGVGEHGIPGSQFYIREVNGKDDLAEGGYVDMGNRTGADVAVISADAAQLPSEQVVWHDVSDGVWFQRIPYLWPINAADSILINIAKLKTHAMGMSLCAKNLQGTIAASYQQHCTAFSRDMSIPAADVQPNAKETIQQNYDRHVIMGLPRWDRPGQEGGIWMETWASRCLDNNSVIKPVLNIIEGIYGHDGHFISGPHDGYAEDFMTNFILFGLNPFNVDIIGTYLAGHEPGNLGLFHLAIERGLSKWLNPFDIPLYEWSADRSATLASLDNYARTPLLTYYLQRDYNGQSEEYWHLVDEPYDYKAVSVSARQVISPQGFDISQNYPNPFNSSTSICFSLPNAGRVRIEIYNNLGERVDMVADRSYTAGQHIVTWNASAFSTGTYYCQIANNGFFKTVKLSLVR
jgi:uncharacterized protein (DUF362 family)